MQLLRSTSRGLVSRATLLSDCSRALLERVGAPLFPRLQTRLRISCTTCPSTWAATLRVSLDSRALNAPRRVLGPVRFRRIRLLPYAPNASRSRVRPLDGRVREMPMQVPSVRARLVRRRQSSKRVRSLVRMFLHAAARVCFLVKCVKMQLCSGDLVIQSIPVPTTTWFRFRLRVVRDRRCDPPSHGISRQIPVSKASPNCRQDHTPCTKHPRRCRILFALRVRPTFRGHTRAIRKMQYTLPTTQAPTRL
jgi:hypothetical protein